jgi:type VI secretion system protein ImpE
MTVSQYFKAGQLKEAIQALGEELRDNPADSKRRTFLFELLCFAGEFDRAQKHLAVLAQGGPDAQVGTLLYRSAMAADRVRQNMFVNGDTPPPLTATAERPGTLNGRRFQTLEDADPRFGARLEVYAAGEYVLLPLAYCSSLKMEAPKLLRDLLWSTAIIDIDPAYRNRDLGQLLLPMLYPLSWQHPSNDVKLGRATEWQGDIPFGHRLLVMDGEETVPLAEVREIVFDPASTSAEPS